MSDCCNPTTPVGPCVKNCPQLYDACCVVNEAELPCIIPPVVLTDTNLIAGSYTVTNALVATLVPNPFYGVITVTSDASGCIDEDTVVKKITGSTITLNNPVTCTGTVDLTLTFTEQRQCDINAAIDEAICAINCHDYTLAVLSDPAMDLDWVATVGNEPYYSDVKACKVTLKGQCEALMPNPYQGIDSRLFNIPAASRPLVRKVLSTVVRVSDGGVSEPLFVAAWILVQTDGDVDIVFNDYNPLMPSLGNCTVCNPPDTITPATAAPRFPDPATVVAMVTLDGLTFDTK